MLCGICWRAPRPTPPAAAGYMALGALHDLCGLGTGASLSAGTPLSSCRSCESFTVRRGGGPGWAPPRGCRQAPSASASWALGSYGGVRRALAPLLPTCGSLAVLEGPSRPQRDIIRTNSGRVEERVGRKQKSGLSSGRSLPISLRSVSPSPLPLLLTPCWSPTSIQPLQSHLLHNSELKLSNLHI